jgi:hypothetical protein
MLERDFPFHELQGVIVHLDEVLTMSARMAVTTGDLAWERRYRQFEPVLDDAIKNVINLAPNALQSGADDFVAKPCLEDGLLENMRALLNIAYDYEELRGISSEAVAGVPSLSAEKPGQLPWELIEELRNATLSGNKKLLEELILKVRDAEDAGSANALQELAANYEYDPLTGFLEESCCR